ncbi:PAS domain-containing protein [Rhizorhabdus dicambivorans]|nr:PAS domain-containing protein [Rhizorhabdus dicambivorans]
MKAGSTGDAIGFLRGGGAMADAITTADWSASPLGPPANWPAALRAHVSMALGMPLGVLIAWGPERSVVYNEHARQMLGPRHPAALGTPIDMAFPEIAGEMPLDRLLAGDTVVKEARPILFPADGEGTQRWVNLSASALRDDEGDIIGTCFLVRDVTQSVAHRQAAQESERHYRTLFDTMDEGFCVIEFIDGPHGPLSDYVHVEANAAYTANAGIPDVVGKRLRELVGAEAEDWLKRYGEVLRTGEPIRFEQELIETGRYLSLAAFRLDPPERRQVAVLFQDITARRNAEIELRELNRTLEARVAAALAERKILADIVEGTNAFIQVSDMAFNWLAVNRASADEFERIYGIRPRAGDNMLETLAHNPRAQALVRAVWQRAIDGEEFVEVAEFGDEDRERRHYEMRFGILRNTDGSQIGAYQFVYDVTERLREQERLREAEEALRQAQKMEAVGQLTGGLAHDFNNLLAGISGAYEMIGVRLAQGRSAEIEKYLIAGQGAARRAASLTHRLLAFARRQTLAPTPTVINRLLPDLVELVRRTVGPGIQVETIAAAGLWLSLVDANQLENAILNLCINARDAMPDGGRITIETGNKWMDERTARERGLEPGQYVTVCVSDTGTGIDRDILDRVFDPFFTTKPIGEGTGLGLSMVYGFARQSNGHVRIYSEVGHGTMVCIYLPRHFGEAEEREGRPSGPSTQAHAGETVLVIDDEPTVRMLVADALGDLGYACLEAEDGKAGLKLLESTDRVDLLITDVGLPGGLNGRQVAEAARKLRPGLKILFITGYAENAVLNHGHVEHGMAVLTKPFAIEDLANRVDRMLSE